MATPALQERIARLATILVGLGLRVIGSPENTGRETLRLWSALVELDRYARELELSWSKLHDETVTEIYKDIDKVSDIVKDAQRIGNCAHYEKMVAPETEEPGCRICGFRAQEISVKLQQRIVHLRTTLPARFESL